MNIIQKSKIKNQNFNSKFKIFIISLCTLHFALCTSTALAVDSTPSAEIRTKLEELKKEIASKAAKLKQEITNKLKDKAYIGSVKSKSDTSLTLATINGPKIVSINQDTILPKKATSEEDYLAALGDVDDTNVLTAKKIILIPSPKLPLKTFLWGKVAALSDKLITIKDKDGKSVAVTNSSQTAMKINDFVILTGRAGKNGIFDAEFVYTIPQGGILKPKKFATPSAQTSSPSAKPNERQTKPASR